MKRSDFLKLFAAVVATPRLRGQSDHPEPKSTEIFVNNVSGDLHFDGRAANPAGSGQRGPCATIGQALHLAPASARIIIANTGKDYYESFRVEGLNKGRPGAPLVIEGNGAAVNGLVTVPAACWTLLRDDIYYFEDKPSYAERLGYRGGMPNSNWLMHWRHQGWFTERQAPEIFFLDGKAAPSVRELAQIPPGGFFYDTQSNPRRIYFRLTPATNINASSIRFPLNRGVYIADDYVVIRNLISRYSNDDGFGGLDGIGVVLENCNASFNCDQGVSFHGGADALIDGGLFERNGGCGICDAPGCITLYRNVVVRDNMVSGACMLGLAHSFQGCRFYDNYGPQITASEATDLGLTNCLIVGSPPSDGGGAGVELSEGHLDHSTIVNCTTGLIAHQAVTVDACVFANCSVKSIAVDSKGAEACQISRSIFSGTPIALGKQDIQGSNWTEIAQTNKKLTNLAWEQLALTGPLYRLPERTWDPMPLNGPLQRFSGAPTPALTLDRWRAWGRHEPGAVLSEWKGWAPR